MTKEELQRVLDQHKLWLAGEGGARADLHNADLCGADLCGADLCHANLRHAALCNANLCNANLHHANLRLTNLSHANLRGADLRGTNLHNAALCAADLRNVVGNMQEVKSLQFDHWCVVYTHDMLFIGCQGHTLSQWQEFTDKEISAMDADALEWWHKWRDVLLNTIKLSPATAPELKNE